MNTKRTLELWTAQFQHVRTDWLLMTTSGKRIGFVSSEADARLIVAAHNAAMEVNPNNPIKAAEALPDLLRAAKKLYALAQKCMTALGQHREAWNAHEFEIAEAAIAKVEEETRS